MGKLNLSERVCNGRLEQVGQSFRTERKKHRAAVFQCECGERKVIAIADVKCGHTKSCGCVQRDMASSSNKTHGGTVGGIRTPEYKTWRDMRSRCRETATGDNKRWYFDRGIRVCDRWNDFANFLLDMGTKPEGTSIDRIDNNKGYQPGNCRWATQDEQQRNTQRTNNITMNGRTMCLTDWGIEMKLSRSLIRSRINAGWSVERAITTPARKIK